MLSHILYSCGKIDLDLGNFFSDSANAHNITKFNTTKLTAYHLIEYPTDQLTCIMQVYSDNWNRVLQVKMSYDKWVGTTPSLNNYTKFFNIVSANDQSDQLWKEYYSQYKDPSWPECSNYCDVKFLPSHLQEEIYQTYIHPDELLITDNNKLLEFLSMSYYDLFCKPVVPHFSNAIFYPLSEYFSNNLVIVKNKINQVFEWTWNQEKSDKFHQTVMTQNARYFQWLNNIKNIYTQTIHLLESPVQLDVWEKAIVIAKVCEHFEINPNKLQWNTNGCFLSNNNVSLINYMKERI